MNYYDNEDLFIESDDLLLNKKGQPRKRKPKEPRLYFTSDTEDAIIEYLFSTNQTVRNKIYKDRIEYAFYKLAENLIHTFKFYYTDTDSIEDLKQEVIVVLLEKLHLFNHSKSIDRKLNKIINKEFLENYTPGEFSAYTDNAITVTQEQINDFIKKLKVSPKCFEKISQLTPPKAYSYFGTIAKRYLINYNKNNYEKIQHKVEVEEIEENKEFLDKTLKEQEEKSNPHSFIDLYIEYIDKHLYTLFPKPHDARTADAIIELFRKRDTLEIFNKKALYIYIREITDTTTPHITKITKKLDSLKSKLFNEYYNTGYISGI